MNVEAADRSKSHGKLILWSITAALSGFLFGFDTVVISGAEQKINAIWGLSPAMHGLAISAALWGTVLGSLVGGWPTDKIGRKKTLISIGLLYLISAIWSGAATDVYSFIIARFLGGLGVGISTIAAPLFIAEISPANSRGRLAGMFQFNIVFGILIAFLSNYVLQQQIEFHAWRWMLGVEAVPALIYMVMCFALPQSPRWLLVKRNDRAGAKEVLEKVNAGYSDGQIEELLDEIAASATMSEEKSKEPFWTSRLRIPIMLAFLVAFFNQMSGINAILYFAPRIFGMAGMAESATLLNSVGLGLTNLIFTFVGLYLIDIAGRKSLLLLGSFGYILSLGICAAAFFWFAAPFQAATTALNTISAINTADQAESTEGLTTQYTDKLSADAQALFVPVAEAQVSMGLAEQVEAPSSRQDAKGIAESVQAAAQEQIGVGSWIVLISIMAFIAAHAIGQGAVIWVLISEVFPNRHRASGQALGSFTHWIFAALIAQFFPMVISAFPAGYVFAFFTFMMFLQLLWVVFLVPETKGKTLEQLGLLLQR